METVTLILPLEATTVDYPSDRRINSRSNIKSDIGATVGALVE